MNDRSIKVLVVVGRDGTGVSLTSGEWVTAESRNQSKLGVSGVNVNAMSMLITPVVRVTQRDIALGRPNEVHLISSSSRADSTNPEQFNTVVLSRVRVHIQRFSIQISTHGTRDELT